MAGPGRATREAGGSSVEVTLLRRRVPAGVRADLEAEGHRLLALSAADQGPHDVRVHGS